ncbi:tight adherence protein B [Catenulispora sp. MAP5-51]|uniref:type II secretion system F family protein n=1 Tax=Catenulispora sp. MAP5-51 TaxID=3156298 RepID=UPI0035135E8D
MNGTQLLGGLFGAGTAIGSLLILKGLRPAVERKPAAPSRCASIAASLSPRRLTGQKARVAACAAGASGLATWTGWPAIAVIGFLALWHLPRVLGPDRVSRHAIELSDAVATFAEMLRDTLSAAAGLQQAVMAAAPLAPRPITTPCMRLAEQIDEGTPLAQAVATWADQVADRHADVVAGCLIIASRRQSGNTAAVLNSVAASAREQASIRRRAVASQAKPRTSVRVTICVVLALFGMLLFGDAQFMAPYDSLRGQIVLAVASGLFGVALRWMDKILHPDPEPRVLTHLVVIATSRQEVAAW